MASKARVARALSPVSRVRSAVVLMCGFNLATAALVLSTLGEAQRPIQLRQYPWRCPLKNAELADFASNLRHELNRARARANDRDIRASEVDAEVPLGGME